MIAIAIRIFDGPRMLCDYEPLDAALEIGRIRDEDNSQELFRRFRTHEGRDRINVASDAELIVSRKPIILAPQSDGTVLVTNTSTTVQPDVDGVPLAADRSHVVGPGAVIKIGTKRIEIFSSGLQSLAEPSLVPGRSAGLDSSVKPDLQITYSADFVIRCFQSISLVLHSAKSTAEFFQLASRAMVELLYLDSGRVLLQDAGQWRDAIPADLPKPSERVLRWVLTHKDTCWEVPRIAHDLGGQGYSLEEVQAVVAAPILDANGDVLGALYGERRSEGRNPAPTIERPAALLVKTLADGVAAGLDRLEKERAALLFEQFFTADLAQHLADEPDLLSGRHAEVTLLFCDIRGFSRISHRLKQEPAVMVEWLSAVMTALSDCVLAEEGVLVDYIGDELMAMWGAPKPQSDHAERACRAALGMVAEVNRLSPIWEERIGEPFGVGVGINTGQAFVGNTGSLRKFKYGPLGDAVNAASRVQGATKQFGCQILITSPTRNLLDDQFATRRLRRVRVVNIQDPIELFELAVAPDDAWRSLCSQYESALSDFEEGRYASSVGRLGRLFGEFPNDKTTDTLLDHANAVRRTPNDDIAPVWTLPAK